MCMDLRNTENDPELSELQNQVLETVFVESEGGKSTTISQS